MNCAEPADISQPLRAWLDSGTLQSHLQQQANIRPEAKLISVVLELPPTTNDCLPWLATLRPQQAFWYYAQAATGRHCLGLGMASFMATAGEQRFSRLQQYLDDLGLHWLHDGRPLAFAGFAFSPHTDASFPNALLCVPRLMLESTPAGLRATLTVNADARHASVNEARTLLQSVAPPRPSGSIRQQKNFPNNSHWRRQATAALHAIAAGKLQKLVLTRRQRLTAENHFAAAPILAKLHARHAESSIYAYSDGKQTFLGATPECLISLQAGRLNTDALAGTAWPGSPTLASDKNRREQAFVVKAIVTALESEQATEITVDEINTCHTGELSHWHSRISAVPHPQTKIFAVIAALHPTPAVGGFPCRQAEAWLHQQQEVRRGWYSGGFGVVNAATGEGEFSVALRSALLQGPHAELQAGAGLVAGSDPQLELAEIEAKLAILGQILQSS